MNDDMQNKLNELVKQSDLFVSSPETIERLKARGLPIKSVFITYKEYLEKLFTEKQSNPPPIYAHLLNEYFVVSDNYS